jgi:hypothetical protein
MNVIRVVLFEFYISRGEKIWDDYIKFYKLDTHMAMQKKHVWLFFMFNEFLSFFKKSFPSGTSFINWYLLIMDGHGNHVSLESIDHSKKLRLNMITWPSHTSHAL